MQTTPSSIPFDAANGLSVYDTFTRIHAENSVTSHGTLQFLIWHREFIYQFETELRRFSPGIALPYWDFALDAARPYESVIFDADLFGGADFGPINSGAFANLLSNYPNTHLVLRYIRTGAGGRTNPLDSVYDDSNVMRQSINNGSLTFEAWASALEFSHALPHLRIGGEMLSGGANFGEIRGDLQFTDRSPSDPIFYMIHGGVDKYLQERQEAFPSRAGEYDVNDPGATSQVLGGLQSTVQQSIFKPCVVYEEPERGPIVRMENVDHKMDSSHLDDVSVHTELGIALDNKDDMKISRDVLKVGNFVNDGTLSTNVYGINIFANLNRMNPLILMRGLKIIEEAKISVFDPAQAVSRGPTASVRIEDVDVDEAAVQEIFEEVKKRERVQVAKFYAETARKPYRGYTGPGSREAPSQLDENGEQKIVITEDSPYWRG